MSDEYLDLPQLLYDSLRRINLNVCQLFIHSKGQRVATSLSYSSDFGSKLSTCSVTDFNSIQNFVSKTRTFLMSPDRVRPSSIDFTGFFYHQTLCFKDFTLIFFASRNEFLNFTKEERRSLGSFLDSVRPSIERCLYRLKRSQNHDSFFTCFESTPLPIEIERTSDHNRIYNHAALTALGPSHVEVDRSSISYFDSESFTIHYYPGYLPANHSNIHKKKIALLGELLNTLKHELSNPLFGMKMCAEILADSYRDDKELREDFELIRASLFRSEDIIEGFSSLYEEQKQISVLELKDLILNTIKLSKSATQGIIVSFHLSSFTIKQAQTISLNSTWLSQIIFNLIINSAQAINEGKSCRKGKIHIEQGHSGKELYLSVYDNGPGISPLIRQKLFEPFATTKSKGTGLGLLICRTLAKKMSAELRLCEAPIGYTTGFRLSFPIETKELS